LDKWQVLWILVAPGQAQNIQRRKFAPMTESELIAALRLRILTASLRVDKGWDEPSLFEPATKAAIAEAETKIGLAFPPLLSRLYCEVANGGFGPAGGMLGLERGHADSEGMTLVEAYKALREAGLPQPLLPLWDWGSPAWSCLDTRSAEGRIVTQDADGSTLTTFDLHSWLDSWLRGVNVFEKIYEVKPMLITNPFTGKPVETKRQGRAIGVPIDFAEDMRE
jgi:SMI1-KNR4 cell-wall